MPNISLRDCGWNINNQHLLIGLISLSQVRPWNTWMRKTCRLGRLTPTRESRLNTYSRDRDFWQCQSQQPLLATSRLPQYFGHQASSLCQWMLWCWKICSKYYTYRNVVWNGIKWIALPSLTLCHNVLVESEPWDKIHHCYLCEALYMLVYHIYILLL